MIDKWEKLASRKLFSHPRLEIYEDDVRLPNGHTTKYLHFGKGHDASMIIARDNSGKLLIQKEYSYPPDEVLYQLPGGIIEPGESPLEGARRELAEEAGLAGKLRPLGWFYLQNRRTSQKMHIFLATNLEKTYAQKDEEEQFEDYWFTEEEVESMIASNEIRNYTLLAGWSMYQVHKK